MERPLLVAHKANRPSIARKLAAMDTRYVEIDVRLRGNRLVVEHGIDLPRGSPMKRAVIGLFYRVLDRDPLIRPLTLEDYLSLFARHFHFWIDLKERHIEGEVLRMLDKYNVVPPTFFSSGFYDALKRVKAAMEGALVFLGNMSFYPLDVKCLVGSVGADGLSVQHTYIDADLVERAHAAGARIAAWTVNEVEEAIRLMGLGVDIIITDVPERIGKVLGAVGGPRERPVQVGAH